MSDTGKMSETDIIEQANADLDAHAENLLDALDAFYLSGFADEASGNVEAPSGHFHRVHRWLVLTDSQGFKDVEEFDSEAEARDAFTVLEREFAAWDSGDE